MAVQAAREWCLNELHRQPGGQEAVVMAELVRSRVAAAGAVVMLSVLSAAGPARPAAAGPARDTGPAAAHPAAPTVGPWANLLLNPGAQAGAASRVGWDAVTIPGWQISSGLPTVVRYGGRYPPATGRWPALRHGQLFTGGAGGTGSLYQRIRLGRAAGRPVSAGERFRLSG
jgi:hypothetical protein